MEPLCIPWEPGRPPLLARKWFCPCILGMLGGCQFVPIAISESSCSRPGAIKQTQIIRNSRRTRNGTMVMLELWGKRTIFWGALGCHAKLLGNFHTYKTCFMSCLISALIINGLFSLHAILAFEHKVCGLALARSRLCICAFGS